MLVKGGPDVSYENMEELRSHHHNTIPEIQPQVARTEQLVEEEFNHDSIKWYWLKQ